MRPPGPPLRAALLSDDQRRDLPVTLLFLATSAAVALLAGLPLGGWLLLQLWLGTPLPEGIWVAVARLHGQAQLVGFAGLLIMGIGFRILPRFRTVGPPRRRIVLVSYGLIAVSVVVRPWHLWADPGGQAAVLLAASLLELAGASLYGGTAVAILARGEARRRADELILATGALWFPIGAAFGLAARLPLTGGAVATDPGLHAASVWALLLGFVTAHVVGVSLRVAPAFAGAAPAAPWVIVAGTVLWSAGVAAMMSAIAWAGGPLLAGAVLLARAVGVFRTPAVARPLPPAARLARLSFQVAFGWLVTAAAVLLAAGTMPWPLPGASSAARHALALGLLMTVVFAVGARLIPALTGGPLLGVRAVGAAIVLTNGAAALRVASEFGGPAGTAGQALSGVLAYASLVVFTIAAGRSAASTLRPFRGSSIRR